MISVRFLFPIMPIASCTSRCTHTECFDSPGSFSSPGYPNDYWNYLFMSWLITAPPGKVITINFTNFDTQPAKDFFVICDDAFICDTYRVYSGNTGPANVTSSSNHLRVVFMTDDRTQRGGFSAKFSFECKYKYGHS